MSLSYDPIHWTRYKRRYDKVMAAILAAFLLLFVATQLLFFPEITIETLVIRATGTLGFLMLHVILVIGPLCRLQPRFLPLLYNRRHLGVTMFFMAAIHGVFSLVQFHANGNTDWLTSLFTSNTAYGSVQRFPFQSLGAGALLILFLMAATSHDFWLKNLGSRWWKWLHMGVYLAYALLVMHVALGILQFEKSPLLIGISGLGMSMVLGFHVAAGLKQARADSQARRKKVGAEDSPFVFACNVADIPENRAKMLLIADQQIAVFKYDQRISAVHNRCKHQGGPLSEGKILDGCITCPWHGYQYLPHNGQSPPPFVEKVATYAVRVEAGKVYVNPTPYPEGTAQIPAEIA